MALPLKRSSRWSIVRIFFLAFVVFAYFMPRWADWNIDSRFDLSHALVDGHTFKINRYHWNTWDKAVAGNIRHPDYYSDKAPGTAILGAAVYGGFVLARATPVLGDGIRALERNSAWNVAITLGRVDTQRAPAAKGRNLGGCQRTGQAGNVQYIPWGNRLVPPFQDWALSKYFVTVGVEALISALFIAFFFWFLGFFVVGAAVRSVLTALYAVGSVALAYSTVLYSHQLVAAFLFTAFALLFLRTRRQVGPWSAPVVGLLLGLSLFTEYTVGLVVLVLGIYALWCFRRELRFVLPLAIAGVVPLIAIGLYNYICFGHALDTGYSHDFCWSAAQSVGFQGFTTPQLGPLFDLTFGSYRGLFYMSPFLLLAAPGAVIMARRGLGVEAAVCFVIGISFILAISAYWGWNGGQVDGPRYLVPIVPFLAFPVIFFLDAGRQSWPARILSGALGLWALTVTWLLFLGGELFPTSWLRNPLIDYSWPQLTANHIAPNAGFFLGLRGWHSLLPLIVLLAAIAACPPLSIRKQQVSTPSVTRSTPT